MSSVTPPNPANFPQANRGQKVLSLVRSLENEEDDKEYSRILEDTSDVLKNLIKTCAMRGLLQGDRHKTELVLASNSSGDVNVQDGLQKKRGRRKPDQKSHSKLSGDSSAAATADESLIFSAVIRILTWKKPRLQSSFLLVKLSADLCTAMSEYVKSSLTQSLTRIGLAEFEVVCSSGIPVLKALWKSCTQLLLEIHTPPEHPCQVQPEVLLDANLKSFDKEIVTLQSILKAAASLVELFGNKLSRSSGLVSDLQKLGLTALTLPCCRTQTAASKLLAALPLTGVVYEKGTRSKSLGEQWSRYLMDTITVFSEVLQVTAPVRPRIESSSDCWQLSTIFAVFLELVTSCFRERLPKEQQRGAAFRFLVNGLFELTASVIARDYRCPSEDSMSLDLRISIEDTLNLLEYMLLFSFDSERLFFATKKRLRSEIVEGGVLSPSLLITEVASFVKLLGHRLFDTVVSAMGYPSLLPHANRILRMVSKTLLTSTSAEVQKTVDSSTAFQAEGQINGWLNTSISLRTQALQTFTVALSMFGLRPCRSNCRTDASSWFNAHNATGAEKCVTAIGGCLMEQLWLEGDVSRDWGSFKERVQLAEKAVQSLESTVLSCGGFMPLTLRVLIESIASASLDAIAKADTKPIAAFSSVKVAVLGLGSACISSPWPSGASSSLQQKLFVAAHRCRTHDAETTGSASGALRLCASLAAPRVPALHLDRQVYDFSNSSKPASAGTLMRSIREVRKEREEENESVVGDTAGAEGDQRSKRRKGTHPSGVPPVSHNTALPAKDKKTTALQDNEALSIQGTQTNMEEATDDKKSDVKVQAESDEQAPANSDDDDDFLPDIVDDGGPDEGDV